MTKPELLLGSSGYFIQLQSLWRLGTQTGCIGICQYEPVVEVYTKDQDKVTYVKMDAARAKEVLEKHIKGGKVVTEYTIGAAQK